MFRCQTIHLRLMSSLYSPVSWMLLSDVESAIILQMATKKMELQEKQG